LFTRPPAWRSTSGRAPRSALARFVTVAAIAVHVVVAFIGMFAGTLRRLRRQPWTVERRSPKPELGKQERIFHRRCFFLSCFVPRRKAKSLRTPRPGLSA